MDLISFSIKRRNSFFEQLLGDTSKRSWGCWKWKFLIKKKTISLLFGNPWWTLIRHFVIERFRSCRDFIFCKQLVKNCNWAEISIVKESGINGWIRTNELNKVLFHWRLIPAPTCYFDQQEQSPRTIPWTTQCNNAITFRLYGQIVWASTLDLITISKFNINF